MAKAPAVPMCSPSPAKVYAKQIPREDAKVGDLFFYKDFVDNGRFVDHVGFYAGNNPLYDALSPDDYEAFRAELAPRLRAAYPMRQDGSTWFPFRRIFAVAHKG